MTRQKGGTEELFSDHRSLSGQKIDMTVLRLLLRFLCRPKVGKRVIVNLLIGAVVLICSSQSLATSIDQDDLFPNDHLTPYSEGRHGSTRTSRDLSSNQHPKWKNRTVEKYQLYTHRPLLGRANYELLRFADTVPDGPLRRRYIVGSIAFIDNPYYTLSVVEPGGKGGCTYQFGRVTRNTVYETVSRRKHGCRLAINAGFFSMTNGECYGNIVANGHVVQTAAGVQNANFGIRQDGSMVVGYLSEEDFHNRANRFRQLVSGVIWLVRNGTNYVNESKRMESSKFEETGRMETFVSVLSARTAVGYDVRGRMVFAQVLGQTHQRGYVQEGLLGDL